MRVVLVLLVLLLLPVDAVAKGAVWRSKYVRVRAYVGEQWLPIVQQTVADMNAVSPLQAPRLILEPQMPLSCQQARKQNAKKRRIIVVCENPGMKDFGHTVADIKDDIIQSPVVTTLGKYPDTWDSEFNATKARKLVCHELMHAVSWAPEDVGDASCVSGRGYDIVTPGPDDIAFLSRAYRKHR